MLPGCPDHEEPQSSKNSDKEDEKAQPRPSTVIDKDESLGKFDAAKLRKLRPSFKKNGGSVTAGNASNISDGAAALVLVSGNIFDR